MLQVENLSVSYGKSRAVEELTFSVEPGQWLMIVGPNGAGKSTALSAIAQTAPYTGSVVVDGENARKIKPGAFARKVGMLSQKSGAVYDYTVEQIVTLGRYCRSSGFFHSEGVETARAVNDALKVTGMEKMRHQSIQRISGGEQQRAFLAQIIAQNPKYFMLDEPANHLDLAYQRDIFSTIKKWLQSGDRAVISVVHDLSLAKKYGTHAVLMSHGKAAACGTAEEVLTNQNLSRVYGIDVAEWMSDMYSQWQ